MPRNQRDENIIVTKPTIVDNQTISNGTENVTISNVAPTGVGTATISKWLKVNSAGVDYYIPMWT